MQATLALRFGGEGILKMKGIPFKAGAGDVRKFFAAYKIKPDGVRWAPGQRAPHPSFHLSGRSGGGRGRALTLCVASPVPHTPPSLPRSFIMHADGRPTGMAFIEFETPQEAVRAMEKDRAKFGPEYGDRFCMLQLVGRHEMDKVQLQREGDMAPKQLLVSRTRLAVLGTAGWVKRARACSLTHIVTFGWTARPLRAVRRTA